MVVTPAFATVANLQTVSGFEYGSGLKRHLGGKRFGAGLE
jgi:hypothetical protein